MTANAFLKTKMGLPPTYPLRKFFLTMGILAMRIPLKTKAPTYDYLKKSFTQVLEMVSKWPVKVMGVC